MAGEGKTIKITKNDLKKNGGAYFFLGRAGENEKTAFFDNMHFTVACKDLSTSLGEVGGRGNQWNLMVI